jgi:hypothetical protein
MRLYVDSTKEELHSQLLNSLSDTEPGNRQSKFAEYQNASVRFFKDHLDVTLTEDLERMMDSLQKYPITICQSANAVGKSYTAALAALWFYICYPGSQVYVTASPEGNLRRILFGYIRDQIEKHPQLFKNHNIKNLHIDDGPLHFISGVTVPLSGSASVRESKFSGKHAPALLFLMDEADNLPDEIFRAAESCLSGGFARMLCMFNPRSPSGEVYRMIRDGRGHVVKLSALTHVNVVTGENPIPGAVDRPTTARRIAEWCRPLTDDEVPEKDCFELPGYLVGIIAESRGGVKYSPLKPGWYKVMQPEFDYMVLGRFPARGSTKLISRTWADAARSRWDVYVAEHGEKPPLYVSGLMGFDIAEYGSDACCACFRYGSFVERVVVWGGMDLASSIDRGVAEYRSRGINRVYCDATGLGAGVAPQMSRLGCSASGIKVASRPTESTDLGEFKILRDQLWWSVREWLRTDPGAMLPPDEQLLEELLVPNYKIENGKIRIMKKDTMRELLRRSPDRADALCLTFASGGFFQDCDFT